MTRCTASKLGRGTSGALIDLATAAEWKWSQLDFTAGRRYEPAYMLSVFRRSRLAKFRLLAYVVSIVLVFSCICFDVLDVDDSDLPINIIQINSQIVADAPRRSAADNLIDQLVLSFAWVSPEQAPSLDSVDLRDQTVPMPTRLTFCRTRGCRIALPRSAPSDTIPAASV